MTKEDVDAAASNDVGELLSRFPGVNLKSYGGVGGLKTISVRSLGANHSSVQIDGFSQANGQTGQVNLGNINSNNIVGVAVSVGDQNSYMNTVSSVVAGNTILVQTYENTFQSDTFSIRSSVRYGSFNFKDTYAAAKYGRRSFISVFGSFRDQTGDYPYSFLNGSNWEEKRRKNNDLLNYQFGSSMGLSNAKNDLKFRLGYRSSFSDQGLPGAVILYNDNADERLATNSHVVFADLLMYRMRSTIRTYASASQMDLTYSDPNYLNSIDGLENQFTNRNAQLGVNSSLGLSPSLSITAGAEYQINDLHTNDTSFAIPVRNQLIGLGGLNWSDRIGLIKVQGALQYVNEENREGESAKDILQLNPTLSYLSNVLGKRHWRHRFFYRNSFRMPTFNELYYNNIGNTMLDPETAHQFSYGIEFVPWEKKFDVNIRANGFFNVVNNKILAIPTKNLFVWSMQNITDVQIYGGEVYFDAERKWNKTSLFLKGQYTFQRTIDVTEGSLNYGDQIAYTPKHIANLTCTGNVKSSGVQIVGSFTSARYALNENIEANELPAFFILDLAVFHTFEFKEKNKLKLQFNLKNALNESYSYIKSFVMPGRNFLISVNYAFN